MINNAVIDIIDASCLYPPKVPKWSMRWQELRITCTDLCRAHAYRL